MKYLISFILLSFSLNAQYSECDSLFYQPMFKSEIPNQFCELNTEMPLEIKLSYFALDSVCSKVEYNNWEQFLDNQVTLNDTMKIMMKYFYNLVDYNPILFYNNISYIFQDFSIHPLSVYLDFRKKLTEVSPSPMLDEAILFSHYILKVHIIETVSMVDLNSIRGVTLKSVKCEITDLIKGKIAPKTNFIQPIIDEVNLSEIILLDSSQVLEDGSIIEFAYSPDWTLGESSDFEIRDTSSINSNGIIDSLGNSWIMPNNDYIVFLENIGYCGDSKFRYISIRPIGLESLTYTMYPIKSDGTVYNPGNDFGFGNLNYSQFILAIKNRIDEIKNFNKLIEK